MNIFDPLIDVFIRLLEVLFWPAQWWKEHNENSRIGTSPIEKEAEHCWTRIALIILLVITAIVTVGWWLV
mgnify:CR=1 FL=1